jgi:hypothetical protein
VELVYEAIPGLARQVPEERLTLLPNSSGEDDFVSSERPDVPPMG